MHQFAGGDGVEFTSWLICHCRNSGSRPALTGVMMLGAARADRRPGHRPWPAAGRSQAACGSRCGVAALTYVLLTR